MRRISFCFWTGSDGLPTSRLIAHFQINRLRLQKLTVSAFSGNTLHSPTRMSCAIAVQSETTRYNVSLATNSSPKFPNESRHLWNVPGTKERRLSEKNEQVRFIYLSIRRHHRSRHNRPAATPSFCVFFCALSSRFCFSSAVLFWPGSPVTRTLSAEEAETLIIFTPMAPLIKRFNEPPRVSSLPCLRCTFRSSFTIILSSTSWRVTRMKFPPESRGCDDTRGSYFTTLINFFGILVVPSWPSTLLNSSGSLVDWSALCLAFTESSSSWLWIVKISRSEKAPVIFN